MPCWRCLPGDRIHVHFWGKMTSNYGPVWSPVTVSIVDANGAPVPTTLGPNRAPQLTGTLGGDWELFPLVGLARNQTAGLQAHTRTHASVVLQKGVVLMHGLVQ